jgi:uncharacterized membrane protein
VNIFTRDWYKQKNQSDHLPAVIFNLCRLLGIPITITGLRLAVKGHPDFPSLFSIVESLKRFGINSKALQGTVSDLSKDDYPSIAHLNTDKFVVLEDINTESVQLLDPSKGRTIYSLANFTKIWSGVILRVNPGQDAGETDYHIKKRKEAFAAIRKFFVIPGLILLSTIIYSYGLIDVAKPFELLILWGVKLIGLAVCFIMFSESSIMQYFCSLGKRVNCLRVLNSPAGKIFGVSMAELGLLYFSGGLLTMLLMLYMGDVVSILFFLALLNALTLPYTFFSIYYQRFVVKFWCLLCLSVQALFWIEFYFLSGSNFKGFNEKSWNAAPLFIIGFAISTLIWLGLRSLLIKAKYADYLEQKLFWSNFKEKKSPNP